MSHPAERLRDALRDGRTISFADFMAEALYGEGGYYRRERWPVGGAGDFVTGASLSPLFGAATARLLARLDAALGEGAELLEAGCGDGRHLAAIATHPLGHGRRLRGWDPARRPLAVGVEAVDELAAVAERSVRGLLFSYELFDALPVTRLVGGRDGDLGERRVALDGEDRFTWVDGEASDAARGFWRRHGLPLEPGQVADVALAWESTYRALARRLERGLLVSCDYGYLRRELYDPRARRHGTLACYRGHRVSREALAAVGEQDLTAHVDFSLLLGVGEEEGLTTVALTRQANWLASCGLFEELQEAPRERRLEAMALLDLEGMGEEIRVLVQARGVDGEALFDPPLIDSLGGRASP